MSKPLGVPRVWWPDAAVAGRGSELAERARYNQVATMVRALRVVHNVETAARRGATTTFMYP